MCSWRLGTRSPLLNDLGDLRVGGRKTHRPSPETRGFVSRFMTRPGRLRGKAFGRSREWTDTELRKLGLGLDLSLSPHNMHPFDLTRATGAGLDEFVVAVDEQATADSA